MKIILLSLVTVFSSHKGECKVFDYGVQELSEDIATQPLQRINIVLICVNKALSQQLSPHSFLELFKIYPTINIEYRAETKCPDLIENDDGTILAVIAPKPFATISKSEIPMYFYDVPYFKKEYVDVFPNAIVHVKNWRPLRHAFTHFFKSQEWKRIAIISDNTAYSAAFEEELVGQLHEEQFVYNVQRCVQVSKDDECNFTEALQFVEKQKAFIVVLNVDAVNAETLARAASRQPSVWQQYAWLFRDLEAANAVAKEFTLMFSFTLAPKLDKQAYIKPYTKVPYGPQLSSMLQGMKLLSDAVEMSKRERIDHFYRDIAKHMNSIIKSDTCKIQAFIEQVPASRAPHSLISVLNINDQTASVSYSYNISRVFDLEDCTLMRSNIFTAPCNDSLIIFFVFVIMIFAVMMFLLAYFFNRYLVWM